MDEIYYLKKLSKTLKKLRNADTTPEQDEIPDLYNDTKIKKDDRQSEQYREEISDESQTEYPNINEVQKIKVKEFTRRKQTRTSPYTCAHIFGDGSKCTNGANAKYCFKHKNLKCHKEEMEALGISVKNYYKSKKSGQIVQ